MAISLLKGSSISLTKEAPGLKNIVVGLGWDTNKVEGGVLSRFFGSGSESSADFDLDASAFLLGENGKLPTEKHLVYYRNLKSPDNSVQHQGDNLTGEGDGDDEVINVNLKQLPVNIQKLVFTVTIYEAVSRKQNFGMVKNAFIRVVNLANRQEIFRYNLGEEFSSETGINFGELYLHKGEWKFKAVGEGLEGGLEEMKKNYS